MKKNLLTVFTTLVLFTSAAFAVETKGAKDCGACEECCKDCGAKITSTESAQQHATAHADEAKKKVEARKDADC
jgi:hypothetical protein